MVVLRVDPCSGEVLVSGRSRQFYRRPTAVPGRQNRRRLGSHEAGRAMTNLPSLGPTTTSSLGLNTCRERPERWNIETAYYMLCW